MAKFKILIGVECDVDDEESARDIADEILINIEEYTGFESSVEDIEEL